MRRADALGVGIAGVLLFGVVSCGGSERADDSGPNVQVSAGVETIDVEVDGIRQVDDRGRSLPFETRHSNRWNGRNDGTTYEPCTALLDQGLLALGIDPSSVRDAAGTDGQTLRGCRWEYRDLNSDGAWSVSQIVANAEGIEAVKRIRSSESEIWRDDVVVGGRTIGVLTRPTVGNCGTYVQSGRAVVNTIVFNHGDPPVSMDALCERALEFTRATLDQMPE